MRAVVIDEPGGPEVLRLDEAPEPEPAPGEVLVDVVAAGVNRADLLQRQGFYPPPPGASDLLGLECSGTVADPGNSSFALGDPVCALLTGGGYASRVAVPAGQAMPIPAGMDLIQAAALPEVAATVYSNLTMTAHLRSGEWVLIHGGSGGIGTFAIQWARAIGARVAVTAGTEAKLRRCAELGAEVLINYREDDFVSAIRDATGGAGADVILDVMGAKYLERNIAALAADGRLMVIGLQGGVKAEINLNALISKRGTLAATSLRSRPDEQKAAICRGLVEAVWPLVAAGRIRPVIDRVLPMADAAAAHRVMAGSEHVGKIVLTV